MKNKILLNQRIVKSKTILRYPAKIYFQLWKIDKILIIRFIRLTLVPNDSPYYFIIFAETELLERQYKGASLFRTDFSMKYETFLKGIDFKILIMEKPII